MFWMLGSFLLQGQPLSCQYCLVLLQQGMASGRFLWFAGTFEMSGFADRHRTQRASLDS